MTDLQKHFDQWGVSQDFSQIDWSTEPNNLADVVIAFIRLGSLDDFNLDLIFSSLETEEGKEKLRNLFDAINGSALLQPVFRTVVESLVKEIDASVDLSAIDFDTIDWVGEFEIIKNVKEMVEELDEGIETLTADTIENLMLEASKGEITTLIVGKMINESLEEMFKEYNPKVDGELVFDYTNKEVLAGMRTTWVI